MPSRSPRHPVPHVAAGPGFDALRDATAAVKCCAAGDSEGLHAILTGTDDPRLCFGMLAALTTRILIRSGLEGNALAEFLAGYGSAMADGILDLNRPAETGGTAGA